MLTVESVRGKSTDQLVSLIKQHDLAAITVFALELRRTADDAERDFITFLRAFELSGVWRLADAGEFTKYLDRNFLCAPGRYMAGIRTLNIIPKEVIDEISFQAAREAAKVEDPARREQAIIELQNWTRHNKRPPSAQKAREIACLRPIQQNVVQSQITLLRQENERLRVENNRLRALVTELGGDPSRALSATASAAACERRRGKQRTGAARTARN